MGYKAIQRHKWILNDIPNSYKVYDSMYMTFWQEKQTNKQTEDSKSTNGI